MQPRTERLWLWVWCSSGHSDRSRSWSESSDARRQCSNFYTFAERSTSRYRRVQPASNERTDATKRKYCTFLRHRRRGTKRTFWKPKRARWWTAEGCTPKRARQSQIEWQLSKPRGTFQFIFMWSPRWWRARPKLWILGASLWILWVLCWSSQLQIRNARMDSTESVLDWDVP